MKINYLQLGLTQFFLLFYFCVFAQNNIDPHTKDFDFWIGEWVVYQNGTDKIAGQSKITSILNGTAIQEFYKSESGNYEGTSLNTYNKEEKRWEQYWVDNSGLTLHITGNIVDGSMVLQNQQKIQATLIENRVRWTPNEDGTVRQLWEQKSPEQEDWQIAFDGLYKKKN